MTTAMCARYSHTARETALGRTWPMLKCAWFWHACSGISIWRFARRVKIGINSVLLRCGRSRRWWSGWDLGRGLRSVELVKGLWIHCYSSSLCGLLTKDLLSLHLGAFLLLFLLLLVIPTTHSSMFLLQKAWLLFTANNNVLGSS